MFKEFFGFKEKPFSIIPDPAFLYLSEKHRVALSYLEYALADGVGFILLTGEIGAGKTTLIRQLLTQLEADMDVAVIFNTNVSADELLALILNEFEVKPQGQGKANYLDTLNEFLISKHGAGRRVLLIVDEAQNLSQEALEEIRMLSNLQTDKAPLLQILTVGQPGFRSRLQHPSLAQLSQRIVVSYHLAPLSLEETRGYISHRLKMAGGKNDQLFTPKAVDRIFHYSGGIPRNINVLCDAALVYGYADELTTLDAPVIEHVVQDKQELGLFVPSRVAEGIQGQAQDARANGNLLQRLDGLEQRVNQLSAMLQYQIEANERRAESYQDTLVRKLGAMVDEERKRSEGLLAKYNVLKMKLNMMKLHAKARTAKIPQTGAVVDPGQAHGDRVGASTGLTWTQRLTRYFWKY
jgi:general secretion pathway protein A